MGEYDSYKDGNGVTWTIAQGGSTMLATVLDDANPRYYPPAEDLTQQILTPGDGTQAEVVRKAFIQLRGKISEYAKEHASGVALTVEAHTDPGIPWWVWALGALALAKSRR